MQMANIVALGCKKVGIIVYLGTKNYFLPNLTKNSNMYPRIQKYLFQSQITKGYS